MVDNITIPTPVYSLPPHIVIMGRRSIAPGSSARGVFKDDWVIGLNMAGHMVYQHPDGDILTGRGDFCIIKAGTPQHWTVPNDSTEKMSTVHAICHPRPHWLPWLNHLGDEIRHGYFLTRIADDAVFRKVAKSLLRANTHYTSGHPQRENLAMSSIEEALAFLLGENERKSLDPRIDLAIRLLTTQLNGKWTLPLLASRCALSQSMFAELFKKQIGMPPMKYLEKERMERARTLLSVGIDRVKTVAGELGYDDPKHFTRRFKKMFGFSPTKIRCPSDKRG